MNHKWFAQESESSCVAACVRMVFSSSGKTWSEHEITEIFGKPLLGITLAQAQVKLSDFGAKSEFDGDLSLDDLRDYTRRNIFPIVGVERHILGYLPASHAVVVSKVIGENIEIFDPLEKEYPKIFGRKSFETAWKLSGKEGLIIHNPPKMINL